LIEHGLTFHQTHYTDCMLATCNKELISITFISIISVLLPSLFVQYSINNSLMWPRRWC